MVDQRCPLWMVAKSTSKNWSKLPCLLLNMRAKGASLKNSLIPRFKTPSVSFHHFSEAIPVAKVLAVSATLGPGGYHHRAPSEHPNMQSSIFSLANFSTVSCSWQPGWLQRLIINSKSYHKKDDTIYNITNEYHVLTNMHHQSAHLPMDIDNIHQYLPETEP